MGKYRKDILAAIFLAAVTVIIIFITGYKDKNVKENENFHITGDSGTQKCTKTEEHFGTVMTITLFGDNEAELKKIISGSFGECERMEKVFSSKDSESELSMLNKKAAKEPTEVSDELFYLIERGIYYGGISDGALDITVGKIINLWGIGTENEKVPTEKELSEAMVTESDGKVILDKDKKTVSYSSDRIEIDLGAIAKGYAADAVKEYICRSMENPYGILDFGGNIMTIGTKGDGSRWNIGVTNPLSPSQVYGVVSVKDECVVTSGNYERYFIKDGKRYHHILNPATGYPAESGIISATIIGSSSTECDALSTACYILGTDRALKLIDGMDGVEAVFIDDSGEYHTSKGVDKYEFKVE